MRPFLRLENEQKSCAQGYIHSWKSPKKENPKVQRNALGF
jgi:hypothetical protein